jgi:host factor-I protein
MKNGMDSTAVERVQESETFTNRKLIRPSLNRDLGRSIGVENTAIERRERAERAATVTVSGARKTPPPEQTHAENFYYQKQMQSKTPMVIVLNDGEEIHGIIEWYDKSCIKITRAGQSNLLIYKPSIKYMYKESEANGRR